MWGGVKGNYKQCVLSDICVQCTEYTRRGGCCLYYHNLIMGSHLHLYQMRGHPRGTRASDDSPCSRAQKQISVAGERGDKLYSENIHDGDLEVTRPACQGMGSTKWLADRELGRLLIQCLFYLLLTGD